jgi:phage regulator Rha-like protein
MTTTLTSFANTTLSMSTRNIADLTGKLHRNVTRDFRDVCEALEIKVLSFKRVYVGGNGEQRIEYVLPKDLTTTLVSGYSIPMRHKIVMLWIELESKTDTSPALPTSYREAMMLAVERYEQLEVANKVISIAAPKAAVYDRVVADKNMTLRAIARMLDGCIWTQ